MNTSIHHVVRPGIRPSNFSKPFWDGTKDKRLLLQYCPQTKAYQFYPRPVSLFTGRRNLEWREVSGHGHLYSFTIARLGPGEFRHHVPYVVALVELDEGVRIISNLVHVSLEQIRVGMPLVPHWEPLADGTHLLLFEPKDALRSAAGVPGGSPP